MRKLEHKVQKPAENYIQFSSLNIINGGLSSNITKLNYRSQQNKIKTSKNHKRVQPVSQQLSCTEQSKQQLEILYK